ncbi:two-component sensor histidine kinase BarA [Neiella marina]|uniref:histidine kinase n=1 Tax=Neiella holothuriorum TaxID=2870530 RepID=A0ABS7EB69_9GAMM|nr:two-component sensor histidine kinase BarA [Neiella holothuriorum]MBW8189583.1 two-component sensor histidine kinase BarA [Neiella holothuriorum]
MTKYGLRTWVILLSLAPTVLVSLLLGSYFTVSRFEQLERQLVEEGANIVEPLTIAAEQGLVSNDRERLMRLLSVTHRKHTPAIRAITVFTPDHEVFVTSNFHRQFDSFRLKPGQAIPEGTDVSYGRTSVTLRAPILSSAQQNIGQPPAPLGYLVVQLDRSAATLDQHRAAFYTFLIVLLGIAACLLFTIRLVRKVTKPISEMVKAIDDIRKGKLETRLEGQHIGELDDLKNGINAMAKSISEYHLEMQSNVEQATGDLRQTLEQIEIQNVELDLAKRRAQEAARVKTEFLANMSHELRTPLNGVLGFSRQLLKTSLTSSQFDQVMTIDNSAKNLLGIINDILDLSKLEAGKLTLEQVPFILRDAVDEVMQLLAPTAHHKGLDFAFIIDDKVPDDLLGDALRIKQVVTNLVGNAIKFTEQGSVVIRISVEQLRGDNIFLKLEVRDSGVGISHDQQQALFQAFAQADASISRRFGGTGLGLVITKRLLAEMGGDIGLESELNKGAYFWCTFCCRLSPIALGDHSQSEMLASKTALVYEPQPHALESIETPMHDWLMNVTPCRSKQQWQSLIQRQVKYDYVMLAVDEFDAHELQQQLAYLSRITRHAVLMSAVSSQHEIGHLDTFEGMFISHLRKPIVSNRMLDSMQRMTRTTATYPAQISQPKEPEKMPLKVLAVDDNAANLKLIVTLLKEKVAQVAMANNGEQAIAMAETESFDIIFMDIQMPNIDGVTATTTIRESDANKQTPVVAVTAHALPEEKANLLASGMDDYLTKPIEENLLDNILQHWHKFKHQNQQPQELQHPLIDWQQALAQAGGREDLAKDMLALLIESLPQSRRAIEQAWQAKDKKELAAQVHRLHGACCYAGVPKLKAIVAAVEGILKQQYSLEEVEPEYFEMFDLLTQLIDSPPPGLTDSSTTVANA